MKKTNSRLSTSTIILLAILFLYCLSILVPLFWGFFASLKTNRAFSQDYLWPPKGLPWTWEWRNYIKAFNGFTITVDSGLRKVLIFEMFAYTILYAVGCAFFSALTPCVMAYLAAKFPFKISRVIYAVVIVTMILPIIGALPSEIQMADKLGIYDTIPGMWIMSMNFLGMYFLVYFATFKRIPSDFSEAAVVDGASNLRIFLSINLPIVKNTFFTIMLLQFIVRWNDYQVPLIYLPNKPTIAVGLYSFTFSYETGNAWPPTIIAACMIMLIPILTLFLSSHKRLIGNISMGGVKE